MPGSGNSIDSDNYIRYMRIENALINPLYNYKSTLYARDVNNQHLKVVVRVFFLCCVVDDLATRQRAQPWRKALHNLLHPSIINASHIGVCVCVQRGFATLDTQSRRPESVAVFGAAHMIRKFISTRTRRKHTHTRILLSLALLQNTHT